MVTPGDTDAPRLLAKAGPFELTKILVTSLEALAASGKAELACRLAGQACAATRNGDPAGWHRFNALLHRLSKSAP